MTNACLRVSTDGDPRIDAQVRALVAERYGRGLYEAVPAGEPADIEVRLTPPGVDPILVLDAPRHTALQRILPTELGKERIGYEMLSKELVDERLTVVMRYRVVAQAQLARLQTFLVETPGLLAACFPIAPEGSPYRVTLEGLKFMPPQEPSGAIGPTSSRWHVRARLHLLDARVERTIEAGWFWLANFFGPAADGWTVEGSASRRRPFDEIARSFPDSMRAWLTMEVPETLAGLTTGTPTIRQVFGIED